MVSLVLTAFRMAALLLAGLYAGGVFFVVLAPSVARMPGPAYVTYWQALNADYGRRMPPLLLPGIAATFVVTVLSWQRGWLVFGASLAALLLVIATVVLTLAGLEPLNRIADTWDPDRLPAGWHASRRNHGHRRQTGTAVEARRLRRRRRAEHAHDHLEAP
ncbi:DUF1772 domain-containing protein [Nonomuraea zeae]|uniref:DUF1772 domain-containing protein n=1 Tax=Nonomuraea zeae TaxID=1642303 RepID=A0A5S4F693_9ACTN|nr:DUF1772 domain-containing protein [Nonomuraea zeae]TMR11844.1 DUF1772 domain-containing protein [Nonomuraea zeae]